MNSLENVNELVEQNGYSLYIPKDLNHHKEADLMVVLNDIGNEKYKNNIKMFYRDICDNEGIIILFPNKVVEDDSCLDENILKEIKDLIVYIKENFKINKVIVNGAFIEGYKALKLYDYCGEMVDGLCIISTHYYIPKLLGRENGINYREPMNICKFKDTPMIVFHGTKDEIYSYSDMRGFFKDLTNINSSVQVVVEDIGHEGISSFRMDILCMWLKKLRRS